MRISKILTLGLAFSLLTVAALADTVAPGKLRGTIDSINDNSIAVTGRDGSKMTYKLVPTTSIVGISRISPADIKPGSYIGTAALQQADGTLKALEVHVFPPSMKGIGEGQHPWDQGATSVMTNGLVGDVVGANGSSFTVKYNNQQSDVVVGPNTPVVAMEPADRSLLVPGAKVIVFTAPDAPQTAARIAVGEQGVTPPM
jgi:opacity protein-like surface antigen